MSVALLPDAEAFYSAALRADADVTAALGAKVYTVLPKEKAWPLARIQRVGGTPEQVAEGGLWADTPALQVEVWATRHLEAMTIARTLQAVTAQLVGPHSALGVEVLGVMFGGLRYLPDPTFTPAQPRALFTVDMALRSIPTL